MLYHNAKILTYDVECTDLTVLHSQYDLTVNIKRFDPDQIVRDWSLISAAWKFLDEKQVHCVSVKADNVFNDYGVIPAVIALIQRIVTKFAVIVCLPPQVLIPCGALVLFPHLANIKPQ